jgi:hypothetical protein
MPLIIFPIRSFAAHAMIDAVVAIGVEGKETEENGEEENKTRWPVMQVMDGGVAIYSWLPPVASCHDFQYVSI